MFSTQLFEVIWVLLTVSSQLLSDSTQFLKVSTLLLAVFISYIVLNSVFTLSTELVAVASHLLIGAMK